MAVDDALKPVVATKEAKPNSVEHLIGLGDDAVEGEIVDGDVDESGKSTVPESHPLEHLLTFHSSSFHLLIF
uniref:Uncharacterized protein n=1 Tax=Brassica oleracea TaxID=3712 RepID=A0A3P6DFD7_BRAOL|nr:unnamed protein product [Brassica oleracea]